MSTFQAFASWSELLAHVAQLPKTLWYHAPMDLLPRTVMVTRVFKNGKVRVVPLTNQADPFTADSGHLSRFRFQVSS